MQKEMVRHILAEGKLEEIKDVPVKSATLVHYLLLFLYAPQELLHWRAVEALGLVTGPLAVVSFEEGREIIRNLFWSLNDESGANARGAPEAIGEIISRRPEWYGNYISMLTHLLDDPGLTLGVLWALGRIGRAAPHLLKDTVSAIFPLLEHPEAAIRGHAAWTLGETRTEDALDRLLVLSNDQKKISIYLHGELITMTVSSLVRQAVERITGVTQPVDNNIQRQESRELAWADLHQCGNKKEGKQ